MRYFTTEEFYTDFLISIVEKHNGNILESLPAAMFNKIKDESNTNREIILEAEYSVKRIHKTLRKLGWLDNWVITIPAHIKLTGPSAGYPGVGRILLDVANYFAIRGHNINKLGLSLRLVSGSPLTRKVALKGFAASKHEVKAMLARLGYAERIGKVYYWNSNAHRLLSDAAACFYIMSAAGRMDRWSDISVGLIKQICSIPELSEVVAKNGTRANTLVSKLKQVNNPKPGTADSTVSKVSPLQDKIELPVKPSQPASITPQNKEEEIKTRPSVKPELKIVGRIELPAEPFRNKGGELRKFRITGISNRKRDYLGQFYEAVDEKGRPVKLLGFDEMTMLCVGEAVTVVAYEKHSRDMLNIYYLITPAGNE